MSAKTFELRFLGYDGEHWGAMPRVRVRITCPRPRILVIDPFQFILWQPAKRQPCMVLLFINDDLVCASCAGGIEIAGKSFEAGTVIRMHASEIHTLTDEQWREFW